MLGFLCSAGDAAGGLDRRAGGQGGAAPEGTPDDIADTPAAVAVKIAFSNASFVVMTLAYFVCGMQLVFLTTHLPSYLANVAAWIRC